MLKQSLNAFKLIQHRFNFYSTSFNTVGVKGRWQTVSTLFRNKIEWMLKPFAGALNLSLRMAMTFEGMHWTIKSQRDTSFVPRRKSVVSTEEWHSSCWFSSLLREVFLRVLRFSPLLKNQHFQIPIRSGIRGPQVY